MSTVRAASTAAAPAPVHLGGKNVRSAVTGTGDPRIRYRGALRWFDECEKAQTLSCKHELRALLPTSASGWTRSAAPRCVTRFGATSGR